MLELRPSQRDRGAGDGLVRLPGPGLQQLVFCLGLGELLYATINVEVIRALLPLAQASEPDFRARLLAEIKTLLLGHMEAVVQRHHAASSR